MAKAPSPGRCKTRLHGAISPDQAARLSAAFLRDITENLALASRRQPITPYVAYAPAGTEAAFAGMLAEGTGLILADGDIDTPPVVQGFGRCLLHAMRTMFARGHEAACVLNADSPTLPTYILEQAAASLAEPGDRAVLGPAEDGGYYLLGLKAPHPEPFSRISWSTGIVAHETRDRLRGMALPFTELPAWYDVDDPPSLSRLATSLAEGQGYHAPSTAACLRGFGLLAPAGAELELSQ
jgi:hypothetical protein